MTNPEPDPQETVCRREDTAGVEVLAPRAVPLGGPRAMRVQRTLPQRGRSLVGAWCFVDHYGPDDVATTGGMSVAPHPHTGLQTVSWLFSGEIEHRDSAGHHALVRPGELNLMTAGRGISHSEVSTAGTTTLHGVQLWVALPEQSRAVDPGFAHHVPAPVHGDGWQAQVFLGSWLGTSSPVATHTPLLGAELVLEPGTSSRWALEPGDEHAVLVDRGSVRVQGRDAEPGDLVYVPPGAGSLAVVADEGARLLVLGGTPLGEEIVMWWNFVGRSHEEVVAARAAWQEQITGADGSPVADTQDAADGRFGIAVGDHLPPIPAPPLPGVRLTGRR